MAWRPASRAEAPPAFRDCALAFSANSATTLRIIAAGIVRTVAGADHRTYLVEASKRPTTTSR
jgi:hypothetical protein